MFWRTGYLSTLKYTIKRVDPPRARAFGYRACCGCYTYLMHPKAHGGDRAITNQRGMAWPHVYLGVRVTASRSTLKYLIKRMDPPRARVWLQGLLWMLYIHNAPESTRWGQGNKYFGKNDMATCEFRRTSHLSTLKYNIKRVDPPRARVWLQGLLWMLYIPNEPEITRWGQGNKQSGGHGMATCIFRRTGHLSTLKYSIKRVDPPLHEFGYRACFGCYTNLMQL
jgi:hypothetical protein